MCFDGSPHPAYSYLRRFKGRDYPLIFADWGVPIIGNNLVRVLRCFN
jgi:hypothetical protein